jgi:response regulator RpfG family c-di-GMP phosphodiesterase
MPETEGTGGAGPTTREWTDVLLGALRESGGAGDIDFNQVAQLARTTSERLAVHAGEIPRISLAGRLHDIGKVAIPTAILLKPGPLDEQEWEVMRTHAETGERILRSAASLADVALLVRHHHERYDGSGYPDGLDGARTPLGSSVITVCAAFTAMMRQRPYSDAITVAEAIAELRRCAGTQFHPGVVDAFCEPFE